MRVGVTGGIGAGKSLVAKIFEKNGAYVVEADRVGRDAVVDQAVRGDLVEAFGSVILDAEGELDRRELGRRAFAGKSANEKLNSIVWPRLAELLREETRTSLKADPSRTVVVDAALLLEWGDPKDFCDVLVVVTASEASRIQRTMDRMGITETEVLERMRSQLPEEKKLRAADFVIVNDAGLDVLKFRALDVWSRIHKTHPG